MTEIVKLEAADFEAKQQLAHISAEIAKGRAELAQLQQSKATFFAEREQELVQRLQLVLTESAQTLAAVAKNHEAVSAYAKEVASFATELSQWGDRLENAQKAYSESVDRLEADFEAKRDSLIQLQKELSIQQAIVAKGRAENQKRKQALADQERAVNDKYETLMRTIQRL